MYGQRVLFGNRGILRLITTYKEIIFESLHDLQKPRRSCLKKKESKSIAYPKATRPEKSSEEDASSEILKKKKHKVSLQL